MGLSATAISPPRASNAKFSGSREGGQIPEKSVMPWGWLATIPNNRHSPISGARVATASRRVITAHRYKSTWPSATTGADKSLALGRDGGNRGNPKSSCVDGPAPSGVSVYGSLIAISLPPIKIIHIRAPTGALTGVPPTRVASPLGFQLSAELRPGYVRRTHSRHGLPLPTADRLSHNHDSRSYPPV